MVIKPTLRKARNQSQRAYDVPAVLWFAAITAVPFSFSLGVLAGIHWRKYAYSRSLEAILAHEIASEGPVDTPLRQAHPMASRN